MTIQANELHIGSSIKEATWVHVADRRISVGGKYHSNRKKLFEISRLRASIGYFGLAQATSKEFFSSWVPNTINKLAKTDSLHAFAEAFKEELNKSVSKSLLKHYPSGFHLCGYGADGIPEFYYIRNIHVMEGAFYKDFGDRYYLTEDFRHRDAIVETNGVARSLDDLKNCVFFYVNGDIRSFWQFWLGATTFMDSVSGDPSFKDLSTPGQRAKWKLEAFAAFYERHSKRSVIGRPIDLIECWPSKAG